MKHAVVEAYKRGDKIRSIEETYGIARATVYWILEQAGQTPDRMKRGRRMVGDDQQMAQLYDLITAQDARISELTEVASVMLMLGRHYHGDDDEWAPLLERLQRIAT